MVPNKNSIYPSPDNLKSNIFFEIGDILNVCVVANSAGVTLSSWLALILLLITEEANKAKEVNTILPIDAEKKKKKNTTNPCPPLGFFAPLQNLHIYKTSLYNDITIDSIMKLYFFPTCF